jgi:CRP-like cAMP-binding protein
MLTIVERVIFLQKVNIFQDIPTEQLSYLAAIAEEVHYSEGEEIYKEGDPSDSLYIVLSGLVKLDRDGRQIGDAGEGEVLGKWALFHDTARITGATAVQDSQLLCIHRDDFQDLLTDHSQINESILKQLAVSLMGLMDTAEQLQRLRRGRESQSSDE